LHGVVIMVTVLLTISRRQNVRMVKTDEQRQFQARQLDQ